MAQHRRRAVAVLLRVRIRDRIHGQIPGRREKTLEIVLRAEVTDRRAKVPAADRWDARRAVLRNGQVRTEGQAIATVVADRREKTVREVIDRIGDRAVRAAARRVATVRSVRDRADRRGETSVTDRIVDRAVPGEIGQTVDPAVRAAVEAVVRRAEIVRLSRGPAGDRRVRVDRVGVRRAGLSANGRNATSLLR